ncbi:MAG: hypothetical protein CSB48_09710 [Proteobacteria bacterium]|nr:MAG: hypothetical protein CSB48_09710 [Pseudomonadota bacterium]
MWHGFVGCIVNMKIVVNVSSIAQPLTGIGHYSLNLVRELNQAPEVADIQGFYSKGWMSRADMAHRFESFEATAPGSFDAPSIARRALAVARKIPAARSLKRKMIGARLYRKRGQLADYIYWEPNYLLYPYDGVSISTIHDLSHLYFPHYHPKERVKALAQQLPRTIDSSRQIITVSRFSQSQILSGFPVSRNRISVVYPAVSDLFRAHKSDLQKQQLRQKFRLPDRFILSVGTMEPRKNLTGLIRAFRMLPAPVQKQYPLVFVGAKGWLSEDLERQISRLESAGLARRLGYVSNQEVAILYAAATVFAYPSFYEGFGMPVAESMASGTAVVTSNLSSMPEVAGGAAELVDPNDETSIRNGLERLLEDDDYRTGLELKGLEVSASYTWAHSCRKLLEVFANAQ